MRKHLTHFCGLGTATSFEIKKKKKSHITYLNLGNLLP